MILGGCALTPHRSEAPTWPQALERLLPTEILLLGERHDAPQHQDMQRQTVQWLAQRGLLAALVMEMAEAGRSTQGLAPQASEAEVQTALGWSEALWPWQNYGPVAMAAVRAGVPVLGGNLPRPQLRTAQTDTSLEALLGP
ncbi:MAG TPA: ChaN family lipoprotein, partial [Giesbergeria sp.]|nr:ChaN family lipoprotein [Giesbergeria sp.]